MGQKAQSVIGLGLVGTAALLLILSATLPPFGDDKARLAAALGLLSLSGLGLGLGLQREAGAALRQILVWTTAVVVIGILVSYRSDLRAAAGIVLPALAPESSLAAAPTDRGAGMVSLRAESSGHFFAEALVDGTHVTFLVDTGATDVALAPEDAVRLGIDLGKLTYDIPIITANGQTFAAAAELKEIVIGSIRIAHVTATIPRGPLSRSLLGMGFLRRLSSFSVDSDRLVMHQ
jgi:aspartyl protease family protein